MSTESSEAVVVLITAANAGEARDLAEMLMDAHLAACVQILQPMTSVFRWKGTIQHQNEVLILVKTLRSKFEQVEREVRAQHSYDTPEIIALPITAGSIPYLEWLFASVDKQGS